MAELGARPKYNREVKIIGTKSSTNILMASLSFINTTALVVFFAYPLCYKGIAYNNIKKFTRFQIYVIYVFLFLLKQNL